MNFWRKIAATAAYSTAMAASAAPASHGGATASLGQVESEYADWLDATSAVSTIDSGLMEQVDGRGRANWELRRRTLQERLGGELTRIDAGSLDREDARALRVMRDGLTANALDTSEASSGTEGEITCEDRNRSAESDGDPTPLQRALYACFDELGDHIAFEGKTVVRTTALQWLGEIDGAERRRQLFLALAPLWNAVNGSDDSTSAYRRMIGLAAAQQRRTANSPLRDAATMLRVPSAEIERWLRQILTAWRTHLHGAAVEPWDYWYSAASASRELSSAIPRDAVLRISKQYYRDLGADLDALGVLHDLDVRPGKAPLAYTDQVRIVRRIGTHWQPALPRVSANYEQGGLFVLDELIHEDGHAVHEGAVRTRPAFYSLGGDLFDEAFADVPALSTFEPVWQIKYLGRSVNTAASLKDLYSNVMLDIAWSLFEIELLKEPAADPNAVWAELTSRYLNIVPHPELSWWALRAQLVRWPGYMVNYGLGAVLTADIRQRIVRAIGSFDAGNPRWYPWISAHLLHYGASIDTGVLLRQFLGRRVSPEALLSQLQRLDSPPDAR